MDQKTSQDEGKNESLVLNRNFTFWFVSTKQQQKTVNYIDLLKKVGTFNTVEDFWAYYQHMIRPDAMPEGSQFNLFQEGIQPMWENEANKNGGRYVLRIKKKFANRFWEDLILGFIGEQSDDAEFLNGLILQIKSSHIIISLWVKDLQKNKHREQNIKIWICKTIGVHENTPIEYREHPKEGEEGQQANTNQEQKQNNYQKGGNKKFNSNNYDNNNKNSQEQVEERKNSEEQNK